MAERLKEQVGYRQQRRASAGQDTAYTTQTHSRRVMQPHQDDDEEEDDALYQTRLPTSARRYIQQPEVYTQGNKKIVIHREAPRGRRFHWMLFMGMVMFVMVLGWLLFTALGYWWQTEQDDWKYGNPRTFQIDQYVGHGDTPDHPDHFIALNVDGMVQVIEINTHNPKDDHVYPITTMNDSSIPVFLSFEDTNHDGKVDMLVTIGDSNSYVVILLNNGTQFTK